MKVANPGIPVCKVFLLNGSPFQSIPKQEWGFFYTQDNLESMEGNRPRTLPQNITALPAPVNGFRITEKLENYDNFIQDTSGYLEDAVALNQGDVKVDSAASESSDAVRKRRQNLGREFFTWQTDKNVFGEDPLGFQNFLSENSTQPKWTYIILSKPDGSKNTEMLMPFMTQATIDPEIAVHWGCKLVSPWPFNQPFEVIFQHDGQTHTIAQEAPAKADVFGLFSASGIDLTKRAYLFIEFGNGTSGNYLLAIIQGFIPALYKLNGGVIVSKVSEFPEISNEALFNPNNSFIQCKVEQVKTGLIVYIVTSTFSTPWIIQGPSASPIFIGEVGNGGNICVYSGNIQCGFVIRPVQYFDTGLFKTPGFAIQKLPDDARKPKVTAAIKGAGDIQQNRSSAPDGSVVYAVDAEIVNEPGGSGGSVRTGIEAGFGKEIFLQGEDRIIDIVLREITPPAQGQAAKKSTVLKQETYQFEVKLSAADQTSGSFTIENGRSPYIWQTRAELDLIDKASSGTGEDISCDVLSVDMSWNSTSFNEISHNGSIQVLNFPSVSGRNYKGMMDRAIYVRIEAGWENGEGKPVKQIFEGMTVSATVDTKIDKEIVTFRVEDYMNALEGCKFVLSPYYDGMNAGAAVKDIVKQLGLANSRIIIPPTKYGLPFNNPFEEPQFRYKDGASLKSALVKIAQLDGRTIYFDSLGKFHYDHIPGSILGDSNVTVTAELFSDVTKASTSADVIWGVKSITRQVNDTYNVMQVTTISRDTGNIIHVGEVNDEALHNPKATGYLGYRKHLILRDPALGGIEAAINYLDAYRRKIFIPPRTGRFEMFGRAGIKPLDVIIVDGQLFRIVNITYRLAKQDFNFLMNIEGEWFDSV